MAESAPAGATGQTNSDAADAIRAEAVVQHERLDQFYGGNGSKASTLIALAWMDQVRAEWDEYAKRVPNVAAVAKALCRSANAASWLGHERPEDIIVASVDGPPFVMCLGTGRTVPEFAGTFSAARPLWAHYLEDAMRAIEVVEKATHGAAVRQSELEAA